MSHSSTAGGKAPAAADDDDSQEVEPVSYFARLSARLSQKALRNAAGSRTADSTATPRIRNAQDEHQPATAEARHESQETEDQAMTEENVEAAADEQIDLKKYVSPPALSFTVTNAVDEGLL